MDHLTLWFTIVLMCCVSMRLSLCELFHPDQPENMTDRTNCALKFVHQNQIQLIKKYIDDGNRLIRFKLNILGDLGPLGGKYPDGLLKPDNWILSTDDSGKSLLLLPEDYIQKSLWTLSFSEQKVEVTLRQIPDNCFGSDKTNYTLREIKNTIRLHLLRNFSFASDEVSEEFKVCNLQIITANDNNKSAELKYICCSEIDDMCETLKSSTWMNVFQTCLSFLSYFFAPLFSPLLIPKSFYKKSFFLFRCNTKNIIRPLHIRKIDQLDGDLANNFIELKKTLKLQKFQNKLQDLKELPNGEHKLNIDSIDIAADSENLVEYGTSPVTLFSFLLDYYGRCGMRRDDKYLNYCCSHCHSNIIFDYIKFTVAFIFLLSPWWIIICFFYIYDNDFYNAIMDAKDDLQLDYIPVSNNELTPGSFVFPGSIFVVFFLGCLYYYRLLFVLKSSFYAHIFHLIMSQKTEVAGIFTRSEEALSKVRKDLKWGCLYFIIWSILKLLHLLVNNIPFLQLYCKVLSVYISLKGNGEKPSSCIQLFSAIYTLFVRVIYSLYIGFVVFILCINVLPFYIEIFVFTITGIMLNFGDVFKYVMLIFLILLYGHQSFSTNVSARYHAYTKSLVNHILEKNREQMQAHGNDSKEDHNEVGTNVQEAYPLDGSAYMTPGVDYTQKNVAISLLQSPDSSQQLIWKAPSLLLFRDLSTNNFCSYIPEKFFNKMNLLPKNFCPGKATELYAKALRQFVFGLLFLTFWIISVSALGRVQELSATVQTIIAVGTGLLPFGLHTFVLKSKAADLAKIEKDCVWQTLFDKTAKQINEPLIVSDIVVSIQDEAVQELDDINNIQFARGSNERPFPIARNSENISSNIDFVVFENNDQSIIFVSRNIVQDSLNEETEYVDGYQEIV